MLPTRVSPRQSGAAGARPCSTPPGGASQGLISGYVLQSAGCSAGQVESLGLHDGARSGSGVGGRYGHGGSEDTPVEWEWEGEAARFFFVGFVSGDRLFSRTKNVKNMMLIEDYTRGLHNSHSQLA
jgi:hypothetical protein